MYLPTLYLYHMHYLCTEKQNKDVKLQGKCWCVSYVESGPMLAKGREMVVECLAALCQQLCDGLQIKLPKAW